jgi:hypothetical protein
MRRHYHILYLFKVRMKHFPEAWRSANLFDLGCGYHVVSRFKADGRVEAGFFLLDVFCLGVKDADFCHFHSIDEYQGGFIDRLFPDGNSVRMTPVAARKLIEDTISYAKGLGFSPSADYKKASRVFGGITTAACTEQFVFGKDGKPFYIQGPSDSPARVERILHAREARCGEGGYHCTVAGDNFETFDGEGETDESAVSHPARRAGLERMAAGLRASQPGIEVRINPPGHRKVSDMIWLVAEPLLEWAPDNESQKMILNLTTLAWNYTLFDPIKQEEMLVEIANLFQSPEDMDMFYYLVDRKTLLFPEEERVICKVETGPALYSDIAFRVAWAM